MNFLTYFVILSIMHIIGDFATPYRRFGVNWKQFFFSEWFLVLNPLHILIDVSPLRRHHKHIEHINKNNNIEIIYPNQVTLAYIDIVTEDDPNFQVVHPRFWRYLALDQLFHLFSNLLLAWFLVILL